MKKMLEKKETLFAFPSATEGEPIANEPTRETASDWHFPHCNVKPLKYNDQILKVLTLEYLK